MRDPIRNLIKQQQSSTSHQRLSRAARRALLATALLVASPVNGEDNQESTMRILPPLPVQQVANHEVHQNPFCEPEKRPIQNGKFHLASGSGRPSIRLKSIDTAIGLQPISGAPASVRPPAIRFEPTPAPSIQANPLIRSEHHANNDLVGTNINEPQDRSGDLQWQRPNQVAPAPAVRIAPNAPLANENTAPQDLYPSGLIQQVATNEIDELLRRAKEVAGKTVEETDSDLASPIAKALAAPTAKMATAVPSLTPPTQVSEVDSKLGIPSVDNELPMIAQEPVARLSAAAQLYAPSASDIPAPVIIPQDVPTSTAADSSAKAQMAPVVTAPPMPARAPATDPVVVVPSPKQVTDTVADLIPAEGPSDVPSPVVEEPQENPVFFSMSDSSDEATTTSPSDMFDEPVVEAEPKSVATTEPTNDQPQSILVRPDSEQESIVAVAEPLGLQPVQPNSSEADADSLRSIAPKAVESPVAKSPAVNPMVDNSISSKRFRPPVAVVAPPLVIERSADGKEAIEAETATSKIAAPVRSATQNPVAAIKKKSRTAKPRTNSPTKLHMTRAQVRSLTIGGHVRRINVGNENVCQAIATGPNQLKLIGTGNGVTRLVVWADVAHNAPTRVRTFEIHVEDAVEATGGSVARKTDTLNDTIVRAFPNANVSVQQYQNRLIVSGDCGSEDTAKKIIRMVRKTCLVPVRDEIRVR